MYSREERIKAIELLIKYDMGYTDVVRELGYPDMHSLRNWYKAYAEEKRTGIVQRIGLKRYSQEEKETAVKHYLEHGKSYARTKRILGYPCREYLKKWVKEIAPETRGKRTGGIQYTQEQKRRAVIDLCSRSGSASDVAKRYGTTRVDLYNWKRSLLCGRSVVMPAEKKVDSEQYHPISDSECENSIEKLRDAYEKLRKENIALQETKQKLDHEVYEKQMELDILEKAAEIIKKGPGVDLKLLTNREKTELAVALKNKYPLSVLCLRLGVSKSSYYYQVYVLNAPDKYEFLKQRISQLFYANRSRYGYRRIHYLLVQEGIIVSEKVVRRIMAEFKLIVTHCRVRRYSSYKGEITPAVPNLLKRDFHADTPNQKWLTDITEFAIPAGKIYLSPIVDCYDGALASWTIGTEPDADLVNTMLDDAIATLKPGEKPIVHSDRGCHYRWPGWISRMEAANLTRSMSKKGCSPDNSACEGLFGRIKNEMFYCHDWRDVTISEFIAILNEYLVWYNNDRIKMSLGGLSPMAYRQKQRLLAS